MKTIKEKKERALNTKLFLKADRCNSAKCALIRKPYKPGPHGAKRQKRPSEYGTQLQEKQKLQITYGLGNKQLRKLFEDKEKSDILTQLERRLDRIIFLSGLAKSPRIARQMVSHGHILLNGKKVTIPSLNIKEGDVVEIKESSRKLKIYEDLEQMSKTHTSPEWIKVDNDMFKRECVGKPQVDTGSLPFDIDIVGEFYAR